MQTHLLVNNFQFIFIFTLFLLLFNYSCSNFYNNIPDDKTYDGLPFVTLIGLEGKISLNEETNGNPKKTLENKITISSRQNRDIKITLDVEESQTLGEVGVHFDFQRHVMIKANEDYGTYIVRAIDIEDENASKYKLAIKISSTDSPNIVPGLYGNKNTFEQRKKRSKFFSFTK